MAAPAVISVTRETFASADPHTAHYPASGVNAGDLFLAEIVSDDDSGLAVTGFTRVEPPASPDIGTWDQGVFALKAAGSEGGGTYTIDPGSAAEVVVVHLYQIRGWGGTIASHIFAENAGVSGTSWDPPNCNPGVAADYLSIAFVGARGTTRTVNTYPTNYTNGIQDARSNVMIATARRALSGASSENPGAFGMSGLATGHGFTILVAPGTSGNSANSYEYTGSGGLTFGGTAVRERGRVMVGTGGLAFAGAAETVFVYEREYAGSGGLTFAGTAALERGRALAGAGGLTFAGEAATTFFNERVVVGSGGIELGGEAVRERARVVVGAGGLTFAGAAETAFVYEREYSGSGGLTFAGAAVIERGRALAGAGGLTFAGAAAIERDRVVAGAGGLTLAGTAVTVFAEGSASEPEPEPAPSPAGGRRRRRLPVLVLSRSPRPVRTWEWESPGGGTAFGGEGGYEFVPAARWVYEGSGALATLAGAAAVTRARVYLARPGERRPLRLVTRYGFEVGEVEEEWLLGLVRVPA